MNKRKASGTVRLAGVKVEKVHKYSWSIVQSNGECGKEVKSGYRRGGMSEEKCQE